MKRFGLMFATAVAMFVSLLPAANATTTGFNGYYDYSTWAKVGTHLADTTSYIDSAKQTLILMEPDNADATDSACYFSGERCAFNFSHAVDASGDVSFNWNFNWGIDPCCSGFNFYINSTLYNLADGYPGDPYHDNGGSASGFFSAAVSKGDTITFSAFSADACCGAASTTITNFAAPSGSVPEPSSVLLIGVSIAALQLARRKKGADRK